MKRTLLMLTLIPLALCLATTQVSAKAELWLHDVGKDVGESSDIVFSDLPPEFYPYTQVEWTSTMTWNYRWVYHTVFDGNRNLHTKVQYISDGTVQNEFRYWNVESQEWISAGGWYQKLRNIWGQNELVVDLFAETQTSKQLNVGQETLRMEMMDPLTGEVFIYEYMVVRYMMIKWVNGELQFENSWEIMHE